jgi:hypothetical protein
MPEDLLLELETTAPVAGRLENIEDLMRVVVREVGGAVEDMKGSASAFESAWQRLIVEIAKGKTAEIQADRPRLLGIFEKQLGRLKQTYSLAAWLNKLGSANVPDPAALLPEIAGMERLKTSVFDRWQSADDLEQLAVSHYPLSQARLQQIAIEHAPPAEWYQGEEERLFQE